MVIQAHLAFHDQEYKSGRARRPDLPVTPKPRSGREDPPRGSGSKFYGFCKHQHTPHTWGDTTAAATHVGGNSVLKGHFQSTTHNVYNAKKSLALDASNFGIKAGFLPQLGHKARRYFKRCCSMALQCSELLCSSYLHPRHCHHRIRTNQAKKSSLKLSLPNCPCTWINMPRGI